METKQYIWRTFSVIVIFLFVTRQALGIFIVPEPSITNISKWASIKVDQICPGDCYSDFNNITCSKSLVCTDQYTCNGRSGLPAVQYPLNDWPRASNNDACKVINDKPTNLPPTVFDTTSNDMMLIINGTAADSAPCYSHRNSSVDAIFTLVIWLMADCTNCSVLELPQHEKQPVHVRVIQDKICVDTECQSSPKIAQQWVMISVRVIRQDLTIFVNDTPFGNGNINLTDVNITNIYIGSEDIAGINDIFRFYNVRYYMGALTQREVKAMRTGLPEPMIHLEDCQCPADYIDETGENNCSNGVLFSPRYNTTNDISAVVDGDSNTYWSSSNQGNVTITLNLSASFQIESVTVMFGSALPYQTLISLYFDDSELWPGHFLCSGNTCRINMTSLDSTSTVVDVAINVADKIQIQFLRQAQEGYRNFIITSIDVTGRCDCNGNAENCTVNQENRTYSCSCKQETNSLGQHCQSCSPNFFRSSNQFDCPNRCRCNTDGVANTSNQCEETGGKCICKSNVEGQTCDTCKPFSFNFGSSTDKGCESCYCFGNGTLSCSTTGNCTCKPNVLPPACDKCIPFSYGFNHAEGCHQCNCTVSGTVGQNQACDENTGQCYCKSNVQGLRCDTCKPGFYGLETANQQGCKPCYCNLVGTEADGCDQVTGQCQCRGRVITNKSCMPEVISVDPTYGPLVGGTLVTIFGKLLGNATHNLAVFLDDVPQDLISVSDTVVVFRVSTSSNTSQLAHQLKLSWKDESNTFDANTTFSYKANPVLDTSRAENVSTFASGGCQVRVYGTNLQSVKYPKLEVALLSNPKDKRSADCRLITNYVICAIPDLKGLNKSATDQFQMTAVFDGVQSSNIGNLEVKPDPHLDNVGTIKFQYPFEDTITLHGKTLSAACHESEFTVLTGAIHCDIVYITDTEIQCMPAVIPAGGYKNLPILVSVGNFNTTVGSLQYLELHETTGFIIIISCVFVAVAIAIAVIIFCLCWRRRKAKAAAPALISSDDTDLVVEGASKLNFYADLPKRTEESVTLTNSHIEPVHRETVFQEPKKGIVNTEAEDTAMKEEFLPKVDSGLRDDISKCYVGAGHFVLGRHCAIKGKQAQLIDGSLQKSGVPAVRLTIKSLIHPVTGSELPAWANVALSECLRLRQCKHAHVLTILGIGINKQQYHILYPRMSQYVLKTLISDASKEFSVRQLLRFGLQVADGIAYLASKDITHKDVAARNCMIDEQSIKLCDSAFSWDFFAEEYVYDEQRERYLPIRWMAPESISDGYYDMRTDVWSFAVLMWELLTRGCMPYHEATNSSDISNFITQGYILGKPEIISEKVYDLMCSCWAQENEHRPSITSVSKSLADILENEDDDTYANAAEVGAHMKNHNKNVVQLKQSPGGITYGTSRLSQV